MNRIRLILIVGIVGSLGFADGFREQPQTSLNSAKWSQVPRLEAGDHVACEQISEEEECRSRIDCAWKGYCHGVPR
jgi:hypothetical protein